MPNPIPRSIRLPHTRLMLWLRGKQEYHCASIKYTAGGLLSLFAWLLWGDFCFTLMEAVGPSILPIKLQSLGASNTLMSVILTTLPSFLNMTVCPWVSFKSDRHRSAWGRRIPFIIWTMPFLVLSLIMVGWSETIGPMIQHALPALHRVAPARIVIALIAFFLIAFTFFNMFVGSIFWYLFNDVVPQQFLGRFMGMFRIVSAGASALYQYYIFEYARDHMRAIFTGVGILYFVGFGLMCLFVREGTYPPPPDTSSSEGIPGAIRAFVKQSFSLRFYWYFYLNQAFSAVAGATTFALVFFNMNMGLNLGQIGKLNAYALIGTVVAMYFTAVFVDRWHPMRICTYTGVFLAVTGFGGWIWVFVNLPGNAFFWLSLGSLIVTMFGSVLRDACYIPLFMRLMPKSLYGQFSAATAIVRSLAVIIGGVFAGTFLDRVIDYYHNDYAGYRWIFIWPWIFNCIATVFIVLAYRQWKRLGGDDSYRPPAPWLPEGFDIEPEHVPVVSTRPRGVMLSMWLAVVGSALNIVMAVIFMMFMRRHGLNWAWLWYLTIFLPIKFVLTLAAYVQLLDVKRDIISQEGGAPTRLGIPHHGVLLVNAFQGLAYFSVYWLQMQWTIALELERDLILFGVASILGTAAAIIGVQILRWIERDLEPAKAIANPLEATAGAALL